MSQTLVALIALVREVFGLGALEFHQLETDDEYDCE